jgi:hypothetical protein
MTALFSPWANTAYRIGLGAAALGVASAIALPMAAVRTPYVTGQREPVAQPVEFDHRHHVRDDAISCLYCHAGAEREARAGIPATEVCMGCHSQVWSASPLLAPVRASAETGEPIRWNRVHDLPDFVYFHHGVHTQSGIDCRRCHGAVESMPRVMQASPLTMKWCLDCHRGPPPERRFRRQITALTTCSACHR